MSVIGYFAPLCENTLYNNLTLSKAEDTLDCSTNLFRHAIISKKKDPILGVMGNFFHLKAIS